MSDKRRAEDTGHEDQRIVEAAKQPITEAVRDAQTEGGTVSWDIAIGAKCPQDEGPWRGVMYVRSFGYGPEFASWEDKDDGNKYHPATPADAATALRTVADALSPDPTRRALEIAVGALAQKRICPNDSSIAWSVDLGDCPQKSHLLAGHTDPAECVACWIDCLLQQADGETPDE